MEVTTIGLDIAKNVFQVHGVDCAGDVVIRRQLRRRQLLPFFKKLPPGCLVGIEACATAHHWGRQLIGLGHEVDRVHRLRRELCLCGRRVSGRNPAPVPSFCAGCRAVSLDDG